MKLSLVVPCYNEAVCIRPFMEAIVARSLPVSLEIIFVDDGSKDETLSEIQALAAKEPSVHYISFSRNFGKEAALLAGLRKATGDVVATLDADLQHPVELLPKMLEALRSGQYDCVAARRVSRVGEPWLRSLCSRLFYRLLNALSPIEVKNGETDYRMMTRPAVDAVLSLPENNRFTKGIYSWIGFRTLWLEFENVERTAGKTKWSFWGLFRYSIEGIVAFSVTPLQLASILGVTSCLASLLYFLYIFGKTIFFGDAVSGYPTLACLILFMGGLQLFVTGILGVYLAKTYLETKHRPHYLIKDSR